MQKHPEPSVQKQINQAYEHGTKEAVKEGVPFTGKTVEGVKVTKKDFSHGDKVNT